MDVYATFHGSKLLRIITHYLDSIMQSLYYDINDHDLDYNKDLIPDLAEPY